MEESQRFPQKLECFSQPLIISYDDDALSPEQFLDNANHYLRNGRSVQMMFVVKRIRKFRVCLSNIINSANTRKWPYYYCLAAAIVLPLCSVGVNWIHRRAGPEEWLGWEATTTGCRTFLIAVILGATTVAFPALWLLYTSKKIPTTTATSVSELSSDSSNFVAPPQRRIDREQFMELFPTIKQELLAHLFDPTTEEANRVNKMIDASVLGGKLTRGWTVVLVVSSVLPPDCDCSQPRSSSLLRQACILGWAIEFLQASSLVADDIMDQSHTRRGKACWYRQVGRKAALHDSFLLKSFALHIIRIHFRGILRAKLLDLTLNVIQKTEIGQLYDLQQMQRNTESSISSLVEAMQQFYTMERYQKIAKYKTSFYTFFLPVAMGLQLAHISNTHAVQETSKDFCLLLGEYYQVQDDVMDCFGDPRKTGKMGTDIAEGKCTWLVVQALQRCNPTQLDCLAANYGIASDEKVARVRCIYKELSLLEEFAKYEHEVYSSLCERLSQCHESVPREVFEHLMSKIYRRSR